MKKITIFIIALSLSIFSMLSASALYKRVCDLQGQELYNEVWKYYEDRCIKYSESVMPEHIALTASIARYELDGYLKDYKPINTDVTVSDAANDFSDYLSEMFADITLDMDEDGNIFEIDSQGKRYDWRYSESSDKFICTDENGDAVKSYDRYHPTDEQLPSEPEQQQQAEQQSEQSDNKTHQGTIEETKPTAQAVEAEKEQNKPNIGKIIFFTAIGAGIVVCTVLLAYEKSKEKNKNNKR